MTFEELETLHARAFPDSRGWLADEFRQLLDDPAAILVCMPDAFVLGRIAADEAEIITISTDPDKRRQGKARHLLNEFEGVASGRGVAAVFLEVARDNEPARQLYLQSGYIQVSERSGYYTTQSGGAVDALMLRKDLLQN